MTEDWKYLERIVQLIESSIDPVSTVEHDVQMPVITSRSGRTSQCDIVIRSGQPPRETITIVEVQNRSSQVNINDFRGWLGKLDDVGAQHLICVSKLEFSSGIKELAIEHGNKVRLIQISEIGPDKIPLNFLNPEFTYHDFNVLSFENMLLSSTKKEMTQAEMDDLLSTTGRQMEVNEKHFSRDKDNLLSIYNLCYESMDLPEMLRKGRGALKISHDSKFPLYFKYKDRFVKVGLSLDFDWTYEEIRVPVSILSYEQTEHGALAWLFKANYESPKGIINFAIPILPHGSDYIVNNMYVDIPANTNFSVEILKNE